MNEQKAKDKTVIQRLIDNNVVPIRRANIKKGHIVIYSFILLVILFQVLSIAKEDTSEELFKTANIKLQEQNYNLKLTKYNFNKRSNNLWVNIAYYKQYIEGLNKYFKGEKPSIPKPRYPMISFILKSFKGSHVFAPINLVEIVSFLRKNIGSGVTIRSENNLISEKTITGYSREDILKLLALYKKYIYQKFELVLTGKKANKKITNTFIVSYNNINGIYDNIRTLLQRKIKLQRLYLYDNKESLDFFNTPIEDSKPSEPLYSTSLYRLKENDVIYTLDKVKEKIARIYTIHFEGVFTGISEEKPFVKTFKIPFGSFPNVENILQDLLENTNKQNIKINKVAVYESKVLKYRPNSRQFIDFREIPKKIKKAFILIEDDNFYSQAGGIDPIGLTKATFGYLFTKEKKGNASIIEQIYEMYLGKQTKNPFEKFVQILGALYLDYYTKDRDDFINLYIQSIPGSFFRDHNYGVKGIIKNYLNKNRIKELSIREMAWLTRIALLPNTFGQNYIRFHILKEQLKQHGVNILDDEDIRRFARQNKKNKIGKKLENTLSIINRLRRAYKVTNIRIDKALREFKKGNELIKPLITKEEYAIAKKAAIDFRPSNIINEYQSYTDQTLKELNKYIGKWSINANLDVEVSFHEREQKILEEELAKSTQLVYNFKYDKEAEHKTYGGASLLIKTHNIKTGKIANKIIAIASKHTNPKMYFNWAVDGQRHFGSIFKWIVLLLYLDNNGTLLDTFYDIPRSFEYVLGEKKGKIVKGIYRPDNWKMDREYNYGHFTYKQHHNIYNFLQSKNNTFVKLADIVGLEKISDFLNKVAELDNDKIPKNLQFKPIYPIVLGSQEINSIRFAQINTVITNRGVLQPITTINRLIQSNSSSLILDLAKDKKQVISREAAEGALFCGYLNTYFGTARRFLQGGAGKTGSSDTDVSFLATTLRTEKEYINRKHLLNHNLLYLVNIGVNEGKVDDGLFGGNVTALNAKEVFERILGRYYEGKDIKLEYPVAGDFMGYLSKNFGYKQVKGYKKIYDKKLLAPILLSKKITHEKTIADDELVFIQQDYERYKDIELEEQTAIDFAKIDGKEFEKLSLEKQQEYRTLASIEIEKQRFEYQFQRYEKQLAVEDSKTLLDGKNSQKEEIEEAITQTDRNDEVLEKLIENETAQQENEGGASEEVFLKNLIDETLKDKEKQNSERKIKQEKKQSKVKENKTEQSTINKEDMSNTAPKKEEISNQDSSTATENGAN